MKTIVEVVSVPDFISDCCSADVYAPTEDWAICMDCKKHCDVIDSNE